MEAQANLQDITVEPSLAEKVEAAEATKAAQVAAVPKLAKNKGASRVKEPKPGDWQPEMEPVKPRVAARAGL